MACLRGLEQRNSSLSVRTIPLLGLFDVVHEDIHGSVCSFRGTGSIGIVVGVCVCVCARGGDALCLKWYNAKKRAPELRTHRPIRPGLISSCSGWQYRPSTRAGGWLFCSLFLHTPRGKKPKMKPHDETNEGNATQRDLSTAHTCESRATWCGGWCAAHRWGLQEAGTRTLGTKRQLVAHRT